MTKLIWLRLVVVYVPGTLLLSTTLGLRPRTPVLNCGNVRGGSVESASVSKTSSTAKSPSVPFEYCSWRRSSARKKPGSGTGPCGDEKSANDQPSASGSLSQF